MASKSKSMALTKGKEVVESYIFASSHRKISIYSERLMLRIVEMAQQYLAGVSFKDGTAIGQVKCSADGDAEIEIPIRSLLANDDDTNYKTAKDAILELMTCPWGMERQAVDPKSGVPLTYKDGKPRMSFIASNIISYCEVNVKPGVALVKVPKFTWDVLLDFSKGFRRYDLSSALALKKPSALRMFKLVSYQDYPITYSIEELRAMWGFDEKDEKGEYVKYKSTSDFIKKTIDSAKEELDEKASWSFTYNKNCAMTDSRNTGRRGAKTITSVTFFPVKKITKMSSSALLRDYSKPDDVIDRPSYNILLRDLDFTVQGLKNNLLLFDTVRKVGMDLFDFLQKVKPMASRAGNPSGYTVNAIKKCLTESYGVRITNNEYILPGAD